MGKQQIGLLFGVKGGGELSGESGQLILQQLNRIARSIDNANNRIKVTIGVNEAQTRQLIQKQLNNISKGLKITIGGNTSDTKKQVRDLTHQVQAAQNKLANMGGKVDIRKYAGGNIEGSKQEYKNYIKAVNEARIAKSALSGDKSNDTQRQQAFIDAVNKARDAQRQLNVAFSDSTAMRKQELSYNKVIARITEYQAKFKDTLKNTPELAAELEELNKQLDSKTFNGTESDAQNRFIQLTNNIRKTGGEAETLGQKVKRVFGEKLGYGVIASAAMVARRSLQEMYQNVVEIDTAMTELKKVTDESDATYNKFLSNAAERAQELGATMSDVVSSTADFSRLGYSLSDASGLADAAIVYKNVGDGISDISEASESIISTMKAFDVNAEDAMTIVDKYNEVGNKFTISSKGVGDVLLRSASALHTAGNTLDESIALGTAANSVVQDTEKVGTALKTISMYLRSSKTDLEDAGESVDGMVESTPKLQALLKRVAGVDILQAGGTKFKSTYQILKELSEVWGDLTDVNKASVLEAIGGKRNANVTSALIKNFSEAEKVLATSQNSAGSALSENEKYLDSINGKVARVKATFQDLSQNTIDSETVKGIIDLGNGALKLVNFLAKIEALLPAIIAGFMSWKNVGKLNSPNMPAYAQLQLAA